MSVTAQGSGSQVATVGTEHTLLDIAVAGVFSLHVDKSVLANGDTLELRLYQIVLTGGTRRVAYYDEWSDAQDADDMIAISVPIANELTDAGAIRATLKQTVGTSRTFAWKVLHY